MMEGAPKMNESFEAPERWRELREEAGPRAHALVASIEGFEDRSAPEKVAEIEALIDELSYDNDNRYVARELSLIGARIEEANRHAEVMTRLGA